MFEHGVMKKGSPQPLETSSTTIEHTEIVALQPQEKPTYTYRISSFTAAEKSLLCELVKKYTCIAEGKSYTPRNSQVSDGATKRKYKSYQFHRVRQQSWAKLAEEYNAQQISSRKRNVKQLRKCWENMKYRGKIFTQKIGQEIRQRELLEVKRNHDGCSSKHAVNGAEITIRNVTSIANNVSREEKNDLTTTLTSPPDDVMLIEDTKPIIVQPAKQAKTFQNGFTASSAPESVVTAVPVVTLPLPNSRMNYSAKSKLVSARIVASAREQFRQVSSPCTPTCQQTPDQTSNPSTVNLIDQRIKRLEMKLISTQIKEHEIRIQQYHQEMQHEQSRHDVIMRVLRTKASIYDANLRAIESQNRAQREFEFENDDVFQQSDDEEFVEDLA